MGQLIAGWARAEITPPLGARLRGYYTERLASGVHDPLWAKALWLDDGAEQAAIVTLDLCSLDGEVTRRTRRLVGDTWGLPPERLLLSATHTHLGPFAHEHVDRLVDGISTALAAARQAAAPVSGAVGRGHEESVAFCRRFLMRDGTVRTNPGRQNPDIVAPTAPIDPAVEVLVLRPEQGAPCVLVNYALHLDTIGGTVISADYPYTIETLLRAVHGPELHCQFLQGCAGDVNHIDVNRAEQPKGFAQAEQIGTVLGAEVLKAMARAEPVELTPLRCRIERLSAAIPQPSAAELAEAEAVLAGAGGRMTEAIVRARWTQRRARLGSPYALEVFAMRLGDVALAAFPGEMFCEYGLTLKAASPFAHTMPVELAFDDIAYVPTPAALAAGGYESWTCLFEPEVGGRMVEAAVEMLEEMGRSRGREVGR